MACDTQHYNRRQFLQGLCGSASMLAFGLLLKSGGVMAEEVTKVTISDDEWKKKLDAKQFDVLREEGTEAPFTSPLNSEKHEGVFACAGCGLELFPSTYKYDSGTGWPSFYDVLPGHVATKTDNKLFSTRTEYHCARCGGHQGPLAPAIFRVDVHFRRKQQIRRWSPALSPCEMV